MKYIKLFESFNRFEIIGYHKTNFADEILENGFDESKIKVAFFGRGFSFSLDKNALVDYPAKDILECKIILNNPLKDKIIWKNILSDITDTSGFFNISVVTDKLADELKNLGYDGILATRENGWWDDAPQRNDEVIAFYAKSIIPIKKL